MLSVSDWPIIMIGPGSLLLVVPSLFAFPVSVLLVGLQKSTKLNLDVQNTFVGSHTEHRWRCSNPLCKLSHTTELDSLYIGEGCFCYPLGSSRRSNWGNLHGYLGNWNPTENCFLTTYHPSFMVHWWVLVHFGPIKVSWRVSSRAPKTLNHGPPTCCEAEDQHWNSKASVLYRVHSRTRFKVSSSQY